MIDYLIELVFKDINIDEIGALLKDLSSDGIEIKDFNSTCEFLNINWSSEESIKKKFIENKNFGLFINLYKLECKHVFLPKCSIVVYKYETRIDVEINFQLSDLKKAGIRNLTENLMNLAKSIAVQYQIDEYFCGLEPAQDTETRLFTNEKKGAFIIEL